MRFCVLGARFPPLSGALFFLFVLAACAGPPNRVLSDGQPPLPSSVELSDTPFFTQSDYQCGPAALATVLAASGSRVDPEALVDQVYLPARRGSLQVEMLATARRYGSIAIEIEPVLPALLQTVAEGYPVIVLQNLGLSWLPRWHYAVIIGYSLDSRSIVLRSGTARRLELPIATFERSWSGSGRWAMTAFRPGTLPSTVPERDYLQAAMAFERSAAAGAALPAYDAAVQRWPGNRMAWLGLGNNAYGLADWPRAENAFMQAAALPGDPAPALNNLALTLASQGRLQEAIVAAERAVAAGGQFEPTARATLAQLRQSSQDSIGGSPR